MVQLTPSHPAQQQPKPTKAEVIREASRRVPHNHFGLPSGFYRTDLLNPEQVVKGRSPLATAFGGSQETQQTTAQALGTNETSLLLDELLLQTAFVPLSYEEGFPTLPDGRPFWAQLDFEPLDSYLAFQAYLEQGTIGKRQMATLVADIPLQRKIITARQLETLSDGDTNGNPDGTGAGTSSGITDEEALKLLSSYLPSGSGGSGPGTLPQQLIAAPTDTTCTPAIALRAGSKPPIEGGVAIPEFQEWFTLYYWGPRARSYDMFYLDSIRNSRAMLSLKLENQHFRDASNLYGKIMLMINPVDERGVRLPHAPNEAFDEEGNSKFWAQVSPRTIVELLKLTTQLQRLSLGIPTSAPSHQVAVLGPSSSGGRGAPASSLGSDGAGAAAHNPSQGLDDTASLEPDERVRRIAALLNVARSRKQSREVATSTSSSTPEQEATVDAA